MTSYDSRHSTLIVVDDHCEVVGNGAITSSHDRIAHGVARDLYEVVLGLFPRFIRSVRQMGS
jgi:hypothetical protein